jgi:MoaA/NifB/PqqE/SkfB family radical SAM enzyme
MECAVITTYRCNARCQMCHTWKYPSKTSEEFNPKILEKLPSGIKRLNITGGEPLLRKDLADIVSILNKKTSRLEISSNGYFTDKIIEIAKKFSNITIRISIEGFPQKNDSLRGIPNGFDHALRTLLKLKDIGIKDIGFAIVISQHNISDLLELYSLSSALDVEFSQSTMHNSFYFHKMDNKIENFGLIDKIMEDFITKLLQSKRKNMKLRIKDWFRAYINMGLLRYMKGQVRPIPCGAGTDSFFVDPWGKIITCNGSPEPWVMGNLKNQDFDEIWHSDQSENVRELVKKCKQNCWMTGTSVPAMRKKILVPIRWVLRNKLRLKLGKDIYL